MGKRSRDKAPKETTTASKTKEKTLRTVPPVATLLEPHKSQVDLIKRGTMQLKSDDMLIIAGKQTSAEGGKKKGKPGTGKTRAAAHIARSWAEEEVRRQLAHRTALMHVTCKAPLRSAHRLPRTMGTPS